jgi:ribonuclease Z
VYVKLTFLGTSAGSPSRTRNVTSIGLQWMQEGSLWLFDCGEGTQQQILRSPLRLSQLERIFFTHLHGDHLFGLIGLLASRSLIKGVTTPVTLYGPPGLEEYVRCSLDVSETHLRYPLPIEMVQEGVIYEDDTRKVVASALSHRILTYGYAVIEKPKPGEFDAARAAELGIAPGPVYGLLKKGETITLDDGRTINGAELVGPSRPGRKVVICGDTGVTPNTVKLAENADVLVHEATFMESEADRAMAVAHSTTVQAATAARDANAKALILTHFSPRYESGGQSQMDALLAEAQAVFPDTHLAEDFWSYEIN